MSATVSVSLSALIVTFKIGEFVSLRELFFLLRKILLLGQFLITTSLSLTGPGLAILNNSIFCRSKAGK